DLGQTVGEPGLWRDEAAAVGLGQGMIVVVAATATYRVSTLHRTHSRALPALPRIGTATLPSACQSADSACLEGFSTSGQVGKGIPSVVARSPSRCTSVPRPIATGSQAVASGAARPVSGAHARPMIQGISEPRTSFIARTAKAHSTVTTAIVPSWTWPTTGACQLQFRPATSPPSTVKTATASRVWVAPR